MDGTAAAREDGPTAADRKARQAADKAAAAAAKAAAKAEAAEAKAQAAVDDPDAPAPRKGELVAEAERLAALPTQVIEEAN
jgi:hypothetical protein